MTTEATKRGRGRLADQAAPNPPQTMRQVARRLGVAESTVRDWCDHLGIAPPLYQALSEADIAALVAFHAAGGQPMGRPSSPPSTSVSVMIPDDLLALLDQERGLVGGTRSDFIRDAIRHYIGYLWS